MHSKNIMHRDLKPENILCEDFIDDRRDNIYVKLIDFGFATQYDPKKRETLQLGSPMYMAPELAASMPYDMKVDVWALGAILFILMAGRPAFTDKSGK